MLIRQTRDFDHLYRSRCSGSAADTQAIADVVKYHLSFYEVQTGEPPLVKTAANIFREMCYNYRDSLTAGIIVAGWDHKFGGKEERAGRVLAGWRAYTW